MPKLNKFVFSIHSNLRLNHLDYLPSNDDIQRTFKGLEDYQIISYIDYYLLTDSFPLIVDIVCEWYHFIFDDCNRQ
ncbi:unnamed protein product, partial [Rotaria sp. Silwood1]